MEQKQEMHDVVEMLLNRMKDYPEDFYGVDPGRDFVHNKWIEALNTARQVMTEEEKLVVEAELQTAKRAVYMGAALKTIMSEDVPMEEVDTHARLKQILNATNITNTNIIQTTATQRAIEAQIQRDAMMRNAYAQSYPISGSALG